MIWKWMIKLLGERIYTPTPLEAEKMQAWLADNYRAVGWKSYYTMRKKYLVNLLANGIEGREYYEAVGRLKELRGLSANILTAFKKPLAKKEAKKV